MISLFQENYVIQHYITKSGFMSKYAAFRIMYARSIQLFTFRFIIEEGCRRLKT